MKLKPGLQLASRVCDTRVVVVRGDHDIDLRCGGFEMTPTSSASRSQLDVREHAPTPGFDVGTLAGKRYVDGAEDLELLCVRPGGGSLSVGDQTMDVKAARPLPSSD